MLKKILAAAVASVMTVGVFAGCGDKSADDVSKSANVESSAAETVDIMKGASEKNAGTFNSFRRETLQD